MVSHPKANARRVPASTTPRARATLLAGVVLSLGLGAGALSVAGPLAPEPTAQPNPQQAAAMARLVAPPAPGAFALAPPPSPAVPDMLQAAERAARAEGALFAPLDGQDTGQALAIYDMPRLSGADCVARLDRYLALVLIPFDVNSVRVSALEDPLLERISAEIAACPNAQVMVAGHADGSGTDAHNIALSRDRAQSVRDRLAAFGVDPTALEVLALGATAPIAQGSSDETPADRRVDFRVLYRP